MKKDFNDNDLLAFLGRLTNKWGTGHESVSKILDKTRNFLDSHNYKLPFIDKVSELLEMLSEYSKGNFRLNDAAVGWIIASLAYLILPTDLIPDFLPGIGFTDDAAVFILAFRQLSQELEHFRRWKELESKTIEIEKE
jgi:uncharacterized membrane protein YkvA (DUF1232 family)